MSDAMNVTRLVEKMQSDDKDYRYMGISDLMNNLGTIQIMDNQAPSLCKQLLVMIEDKNTEVQNLVVKCLGKIQKNIKIDQTQMMIKACCSVVKEGTNKQCDIYATALKEMVSHLDSGNTFSRELVTRDVIPSVLAACVPGVAKEEVRFECLDILADVLLNYGFAVNSQHENAKKSLDSLVKDRNSTVVKRAVSAMGNLMMFCSEDLYHRTVQEAIKGVETTSGTVLKTHIGALIFAAKANAQYFQTHIQKVVLILLEKLSKTEDEELMESILHAFEVFLQQCPVHIEDFVPQLQKALMKSMVYNPNYDEDGDDDDMTEEKDDDDDASDTGYSDDEDIDFSWKARRSAVKALQKLIEQQRGMPAIVKEVGPLLVARFKERDESVMCEVLATYNTLVKCVRKLKATDTAAYQTAIDELSAHLAAVLKGMDRLLRHKSTQIRSGCYEVLSELSRTLNKCFSGNMDVVLLAFSSPITDVNGTPQLKLLALRFLSDVMETHLSADFAAHVEKFATALATAIADVKVYKVSSEAVNLTDKFCNFMEMQRDQKSIVMLLEAVEKNLASQPVEQEARDRCVNCMGRLVSCFGEVLGEKGLTASSTLVEYADPKHGSCRCAMQSLTGIAKSQSKGVLEGIASQMVDAISAHLTADNRDNKLMAMKLLEAALVNDVIKNESSTKVGALLTVVMQLFSPVDLVLAQAAVGLLAGAHSHLPSQVLPKCDTVIRAVMVLLESPTDIGIVLDEISTLIRAMANSTSFQEANFEALIDTVSAPAFSSNTMSRQSAFYAAVVVAEMAHARKQLDKAKELVAKISAHLQNSSASTTNFCVSLLGEMGRRYPEVYRGDNNFQYCKLVMPFMDSAVEDVRSTASQALGAMAVGDAAVFLPFIAKQIQEKPKLNSLLLNSIKEVICSASTSFSSVAKAQVEDIWRLLESFMGSEDEGVRLIASECLGRTCILYPDGLPRLLELVADSRPLVRHCALYSFRLIINTKASILDSFLVDKTLGTLLASLKDEDLLGRRSALYVLNALIHHKRDLIRSHLPEIMPIVYDYLKVRKELITEVEMGPFKHEIDGGVDVRSAAYQVMFSVLDVCPDSVDMEKYVMHLKPTNGSGNKDQEMCGIMDRCHDIRMVSYMMLLRLVDLFPSDLLRMSMDFVDSLSTQLTSKTKPNAVKQEIEKLGELKKMVIKYAYSLNKVSGADKFGQLKDLVAIAQTVEAEMAKQ